MKAMKPLKSALAAALAVLLAAPAPAQVAEAVGLSGAAHIAALPVVAAPLALNGAASFASTPALSPALSLCAPPSAAMPIPAAASAVSAAAVEAPVAPVAVSAAAAPSAPAAESPNAPSASALAVRASATAAPAAEGRTFELARGYWEKFWSGARFAAAAAVPVAAAAGVPSRAYALSAAAPVAAAKTAGMHVVPLAGAGIVLAGAYGLDRGLRWGISKIAAKRGFDAHQLAAARLVARVAVWTGAAYLALAVGGASHQVLTTALGAGGTVLTLGLRDLLGNTLQGLSFLFARPFTIGDKVQIDDQVGVVSDLNLTGITLKKDDGSLVKVRHSTLAAKAAIVFGPFPEPAAHLHFVLPRKPRFSGAARAVWTSLDRGFWLSAAGFAALIVAPHLLPALAAGVPAKIVGAGLAVALAWLTRRVDRAFGAAVEALAEHNEWRLEARVLGRLAVHAASWLVGGGAALRIVGLSWEMLATSLGLTTVVLGIASNNFFGTVILGVEAMFSRQFQIGDRVRIGTNEGAVVDMNFSYVVIQLDENRRLMVPYAVVRDSVVVVQPGNNTK